MKPDSMGTSRTIRVTSVLDVRRPYRTGTGRTIRISGVLGKGGEGTVFNVDGDNNLAAKIYTDGKHLERQDKISTMVAAELYKQSSLVGHTN